MYTYTPRSNRGDCGQEGEEGEGRDNIDPKCVSIICRLWQVQGVQQQRHRGELDSLEHIACISSAAVNHSNFILQRY